MSQSGDQLDCAGSGGAGITDLVFDDQNQERRSWRFCNSRLPRSEVVYFYTSFDNSFSYCSFTDQISFLPPRL